MDIPTLKWFSTCAIQDPSAPPAVKNLGHQIAKHLLKENHRVNINRAFRSSGVAGNVVHPWLSGAAYQATPEIAQAGKKCCAAFDLLDQGLPPSEAWGMGANRGPKVGFSRTLAACAVAGSLSRIIADDNLPDDLFGDENISGEELLARKILAENQKEVPLYTQAHARRHASELTGVSEDEIKNYRGFEPASDEAEVNVAISEIVRTGRMENALQLADLTELIERGDM
jgi:hypothetical protein